MKFFVLFLFLQEKIRQVFDNLIQLDHPNIVKFHKYWTDASADKPRVSDFMLVVVQKMRTN